MNKLLPNFLKRKPSLPKYKGKGEDFKYWQRYVERVKDDYVNLKIFKPLIGVKYIKRRSKWYHNEHRPWSREGMMQNQLGRNPPHVLVEPIKEWQMFVGDRVQVLVGRDKGKIGEIAEIIYERNWCFVEELHMHLDESMGTQLRKEMPLLPSELILVDPSDMKPTEIEWRYTEDGERVRVSVRTGRIIPISIYHNFLWEDFTKTATYQVSDKDTPEEELTKITFEPKMGTFEEDICDKMGLEFKKREERGYWY